MSDIGSLNEKPLHADLKEWYRRPGDGVEVPLAGFVIDLVRGDHLIEIQTGSFSALGRKLDHLLDARRLLLVHPVAAETWIVKVDADGAPTSRRKSPRRGIVADVCAELVAFPSLLSHPNLEFEVAMVQEEQVRKPSRRRRRHDWELVERRLLSVVRTERFASPDDLLGLLPDGLPDPFTTADLAAGLKRTRHVAQQVAYCLRESGAVAVEGRGRGGVLYRRPPGVGIVTELPARGRRRWSDPRHDGQQREPGQCNSDGGQQRDQHAGQSQTRERDEAGGPEDDVGRHRHGNQEVQALPAGVDEHDGRRQSQAKANHESKNPRPLHRERPSDAGGAGGEGSDPYGHARRRPLQAPSEERGPDGGRRQQREPEQECTDVAPPKGMGVVHREDRPTCCRSSAATDAAWLVAALGP